MFGSANYVDHQTDGVYSYIILSVKVSYQEIKVNIWYMVAKIIVVIKKKTPEIVCHLLALLALLAGTHTSLAGFPDTVEPVKV